MEELKKNKKIVFLGLGIIAFILSGICPAIDVFGKDSVSGFKFVFDANGAGFSRFLFFLVILAPLAGGIYAYIVPDTKWGKNLLYFFGGTAILSLITLIALPSGLSYTFCSWLAFLVCAGAATIAYVLNQPEKK